MKSQIIKNIASLFLLLLLLPTSYSFASGTDLVVTTQQGQLQGAMEQNVCVWKGIPYAQPPVGDLRYKEPQAPTNWSGVRQATKFSPIARQFKGPLFKPEPESEDCLYLNVWAPPKDGKKRPVMFWIHGGGFISGSGSSSMYDGTQLVQNGDVVVVTINYRLGAMGFLYFGDIKGADKNEFQSNLGIKDQVAALKWVKENIAAFGGDPDAITIFGESAGAISVQTLMSIPAAKGLFKRAIVESGSADILWTHEYATSVTLDYLKILGVSPDSLSKLKSIPADTLDVCLTRLMKKIMSETRIMKLFAPTVDGDYIPSNLTASIKTGESKDVDLLIGTNRNEANLFAMKKIGLAPTNGDELAPYITQLDTATQSRLFSTYKDYPHKDGVLNFITDGTFTMPAIRFAEAQSSHASTYMYRFDWTSAPLRMVGLRACHGLELPFVFNTFNTDTGKKIKFMANKKRIYALSETIQHAWLNFAKTGNPNDPGQNAWKPYNVADRTTMIFNNKPYTQNDPESAQRKAWQGVNLFE